jgi:hypothetical protein
VLTASATTSGSSKEFIVRVLQSETKSGETRVCYRGLYTMYRRLCNLLESCGRFYSVACEYRCAASYRKVQTHRESCRVVWKRIEAWGSVQKSLEGVGRLPS